MLTILFTVALAAAAPAQQAAPAKPDADHAGHGGTQHSGHEMPCCKDEAGSADCCKGKDADCCASSAKAGEAQAGNHQHGH